MKNMPILSKWSLYDEDTGEFYIGDPKDSSEARWTFPSAGGTVMLTGASLTPTYTGTGTITFEGSGGTYSAMKVTCGPVDGIQFRAVIAERSTAGNVLLARGPSSSNSASAGDMVEGAIGITYNDNYNNAASGGTKKNRIYLGSGGYDFDLVLQVPHQVRIVAADNDVTGGDADTAVTNGVGKIVMISRSDVIISPWALPEGLGDNYLQIGAATETVATAGTGTYNGGNIVIETNTGALVLQPRQGTLEIGASGYSCAVTVHGGNGIDYNPASDGDVDIVSVGVTGSPKIFWDESEDKFGLNKGLVFSAAGALKMGSYASPVDLGSSTVFGFGQMWGTGSGTDTFIIGQQYFVKTTGAARPFPLCVQAEINNDGTTYPDRGEAAQFIILLGGGGEHSKLAALGGDATAGMYAGWFKVGANTNCSTESGARVAPLWIDSQMYCTVTGEEYSAFITTGGSVPDAVFGFETTSSGWSQLFYFDETSYNVQPVTANSYLKVLLNTTQYYIPLSTTDAAFTGALGGCTVSGALNFDSSLDPAIRVSNDTGFLKIVGGNSGSESGANILLYGTSHANTGMLHIGTPRADGAAELTRLEITGKATTAVATWSNVTQSGIHLTGATSAFGGEVLPTGAGKTVDNVITALQNLGLVTQS